jgi:hypothetical protein
VLWRGVRGHDKRATQRALRAYPRLSQYFDAETFSLNPSFAGFITDLANTDITDQLAAIEKDPLRAEWKKLGLREAARRRAAAWTDRRRSVSTFAVLHDDGSAAADYNEAAGLLQRHWQPIFKAPVTDQKAQAELLHHSVEAPANFDWDITDSDIDFALNHYQDSAPGPDGIPYSAWGKAHDSVKDILKAGCREFLQGQPLPPNFNKSSIVFLPKGELEGDYLQVQRHATATRPIALSNTDAKLFAKVLNHKLSQLAVITVLGQQRGFVKGRRMADNIIEVEALALHICRHFATNSGIIMFDFAAAFPSLSHDYIFGALHKLGVPAWFLIALHRLYTQCEAVITIGGTSDTVMHIEAGIKQGCPASGSIFALALDPFVRLLCLRLPPPLNTVNAFADDLTIVALHLLQALRLIHPCFDMLAKAAGLRLNAKKSLIIPLAMATDFRIRRFLVDTMPAWSRMLVENKGKLLGVHIGPGSAEHRWIECSAKFWSRARDAKSAGGGFWRALQHYKVFAVTVLNHIMQYDRIPEALKHMECLALQGLTRGPHQTFPGECLARLTDIGAKTEAPALDITNLAAMVRAAVSSSAFFSARETLNSGDLPDEALLHPRHVS